MAKAFSFVAALVIFSSAAFAMNLGSTTKGGTAQIEENGTAEFSIVFWSSDNENRSVLLAVEKNPDNMVIEMEKSEVIISASGGSEMVFSSSGYIPATSVKIFVLNVTPGTHSFVVSAKTPGGGGEIQAFQERLFNFTIRSGNFSAQTPEVVIETNGEVSASQEINYLVYIAIAAVLIVSLAIYKYS